MLTEFIEKKLKETKYKFLENGSYFGEVPNLKGVWANAKNLEECRKEIKEVLEEWLLLKLKNGDPIPGLQIKIDKRQLVERYA